MDMQYIIYKNEQKDLENKKMYNTAWLIVNIFTWFKILVS